MTFCSLTHPFVCTWESFFTIQSRQSWETWRSFDTRTLYTWKAWFPYRDSMLGLFIVLRKVRCFYIFSFGSQLALLREPYGLIAIKSGLALCKASALATIFKHIYYIKSFLCNERHQRIKYMNQSFTNYIYFLQSSELLRVLRKFQEININHSLI